MKLSKLSTSNKDEDTLCGYPIIFYLFFNRFLRIRMRIRMRIAQYLDAIISPNYLLGRYIYQTTSKKDTNLVIFHRATFTKSSAQAIGYPRNHLISGRLFLEINPSKKYL